MKTLFITNRAFHVEAAVCLLIGVIAFATGSFAYRNAPAMQHFYQPAFGPAVMVAAGRGFVNPIAAPSSALEQFLAPRVDAIAMADAQPASTVPLDQFQHAHRYILTVVGWWWRLAGISWQGLGTIVGLLHAVAVLAVYALLRQFVPVAAAAAGAMWFCWAPLQLGYAQQFRDFAKGPFVLAVIPLVVLLVFGAAGRRAVIVAAAAAGTIMGVGFGFKMDLAIMLPIAIALVVLFRGARPWLGLPDKALATAVMAAAFFACAGPILAQLSSGGSNVGHVALLGAGESFDGKLAIVAPPYRMFPYYDDNYVMYALRSRAETVSGQSILFPSPEYEQAGMQLWRDFLRLLPADAAARTLASADRILNLAFSNGDPMAVREEFPAHRWLRPIYSWLDGWLNWGAGLGAVFVLATSLFSIRYGLFAAALLLVLAGYPSLQFDARHYFHLQAMPIVMITLMTSVAVSLVAQRLRQRHTEDRRVVWPIALKRAAVVTALLAGMILLPLGLLRAHQVREVRQSFEQFLAATGAAIEPQITPQVGGGWIARWPGMQGRPTPRGDIAAAYYVVEFTAQASGEPIAIAIQHAPPLGPCPRILSASSDRGPVLFAFPVYSEKFGPAFDGIAMGDETRRRFSRLYRTEAGPKGLPIELRLPAQWRTEPLFQSLDIEGRRGTLDVRIAANAFPCDAPLRYADAMLAGTSAIDEAGIVKRFTPSLQTVGPTLVMNGPPVPAYVVQFVPVALAAGDAVVAAVDVREGGATVGLMRDGEWHRYVTLDRKGPSIVAVPVDAAGEYLPMVANGVPGARRSDFTIRRIGIVASDGRRLPIGGASTSKTAARLRDPRW